MRHERTVPTDGRDDERRDGTMDRAQPGEASTEQADVVSPNLRTDAPAALSVVAHAADIEEAGMSDEEIDMYRRRVMAGMYNTPEVAGEVARRMMKRGDI